MKKIKICPVCGKVMTLKQWCWGIIHTPFYSQNIGIRCKICGNIIINYLAFFFSLAVSVILTIVLAIIFSPILNYILWFILVAIVAIVFFISQRLLFYRIGKIKKANKWGL